MKRYCVGILWSSFCLTGSIYSSSLTSSFVEIIEKALRAVVFVAEETNSFDQAYGANPSWYLEYLRPLYQHFWPSQFSSGTGFFISPQGHVLTCEHCVHNSTKTLIVVRSSDTSRLYEASKIGEDPRIDLAVLQIQADEQQFPYLKFADSSQVKLGESVVLIGNPVSPSLESSVAMGVISGKDRNTSFHSIDGFLQTDALINSGNSGGPLLNFKGEVIGIVNYRFKPSLGYQGLSFAIPSNFASLIADQLISHGKVLQGFLGIELEEEIDSAFDFYDFDLNRGALIKEVIPNSPAHLAGLLSGDRVTHLDEIPIRSPKSLRNQICVLPPGEKIHFTLNRQGSSISVAIELSNQELWKSHFSAASFWLM